LVSRKSHFRDDVMAVRYLPGFSWEHLAAEKREARLDRSRAIREGLRDARRESQLVQLQFRGRKAGAASPGAMKSFRIRRRRRMTQRLRGFLQRCCEEEEGDCASAAATAAAAYTTSPTSATNSAGAEAAAHAARSARRWRRHAEL
jgi:hypothetical protein